MIAKTCIETVKQITKFGDPAINSSKNQNQLNQVLKIKIHLFLILENVLDFYNTFVFRLENALDFYNILKMDLLNTP